jgi:drug/metabolite transporter (DMT)-like permease
LNITRLPEPIILLINVKSVKVQGFIKKYFEFALININNTYRFIMTYNKINNLSGWLCFVIASVTYVLTLEPSVSFWDCGEFIACAYRLQVSHQPGYPLFAMLGKVFSLLSLGDNTKVPYFTNMGSAIASGATVMFLFWTITALAKKLLVKKAGIVENSSPLLIMGAGMVGALAFAFTDTFWFSAVETIVFAWSSLCTAIVFWAILKWEAHANEPGADKWLVFIAYMIGLSIGIHLLNLLTIPALVLVYYFRRGRHINTKNTIIAFLVSIVILCVVQYGVRGYTINFAAHFDLFFVNTLGLGFGTGAILFFLLLFGLLVLGIMYSIRHKKPMLNLALVCVAFIYFGYSSFVYIPIRATANTNLDNYHPDNAFTLFGYLNRIQYGETPLLYGPYFDAKITDATEGSTLYQKGRQKYDAIGKQQNYVYDHNTILPRIWTTEGSAEFAQDRQFYQEWLQLGVNDSPTFSDNLNWMFSWQMYQMYWRYFMWNFAGRYSDDDMEGQTNLHGIGGNWTTGLFDGARHLPKSIVNATTYTPLYALPLFIGLLGMFYHFKRRKRDALVIVMLFFFTGLAIVLYVNQASIQPRERDYSYVGSFYAFAIWIGLGVIALAKLAQKRLNTGFSAIAAIAVCAIAGPVLLAGTEWKDHDRSTKLTAHDMAYNYLISCPKNAILFDMGDNETYSLWYNQEVENIRPDVRIVNLSLLGADWSIKQMQRKINQADALPVTMPFEKYRSGTRDFIRFNDAKIPGFTDVKDVFDFITSDDKRAQVTYDNGTSENYLPTKKLKITIDPKEVLKNGVIAANQQSRLTDTLKWTFTPEYITKENLAMLDILAHNNWKRPICFTAGIGTEAMIGLQPYLYKEGFVYHLIPFKPDPATEDQLSKTNSLVMYKNMMSKFKWGNLKNAKYLDQQSTSISYPMLVASFSDLSLGLIKDGRPDLARKALHKFNAVLPDINPNLYAVQSKITIADTSYKLNEPAMGNKLINSVDSYITDQLDYNYYLLQHDTDKINKRDVKINLSFLNGITGLTRNNHQTMLNNKLLAQLNDYENKFKEMLN